MQNYFLARWLSKIKIKFLQKGPLVFVANHRNMILDPGMVRYSCKRNLYYLAKHTLFLNKIQRWVFRYAGAIPVYRRQDDPKLVSKNRDTFENAYQLFKDGKCLILFPEGISLAARTLFKIKTGAARIALNAEINNEFFIKSKDCSCGY